MSETLGSQLRQLRLERDCSLSELARRSGVGKGTISELENDRRGARLSTLFALTTALEAPLSALLPATDDHAEAVAGEAVVDAGEDPRIPELIDRGDRSVQVGDFGVHGPIVTDESLCRATQRRNSALKFC